MTGIDSTLRAEGMRPLAPRRVGCFVSKLLRVAGLPVGFMYREEPLHDLDSGWYFMAGPESAEYMVDPANLALYELDAIADDDPQIFRLLDAPIGSVFQRDGVSGRFVEVGFALPDD